MGTSTAGAAGLEAVVARLTARLDEMEQGYRDKVAELEQANAALREEVATLRNAQAAPPPPKASARTSRRRLLQLGGAAAAAGVAAVAADLAQHPSAAYATGVTWQTGVVNSDNQTLVEPSNGSFPDPTLLTVQLGTAAPYSGLSSANSAAIAAYDTTVAGAIGVYATSSNGGIALAGDADGNGIGALGESVDGIGGLFFGGQAPLQLGLGGVPGAPTFGTHFAGEIYLDSYASMWVCVGGGTPGTWGHIVAVPNDLNSTLQQSATGGTNHTAIRGDGTNGAAGVKGTSDTYAGVYGSATSGVGVVGSSQTFTGVAGATTGNGASGVVGDSSNGSGVAGNSTNGVGGSFSGGRAALNLQPAVYLGAPTFAQHFQGDIYLDRNTVVWVCVADGTPGTWVRMPSVANGTSGGALNFLSTPIRLLDTRPGFPAATTPGAQIQPGAANTFHLQVTSNPFGGVSVPAGATAMFGNCTVVNANGVGDLSVYPDGIALPSTATLHYNPGQVVSNAIQVGLSAAGKLAITALTSATDVIIDCQGFIA